LITETARAVLSIAVLAVSASSLSAEDYPSRPVEVVVPFPAGGGTEIVTRHVSIGLTKQLGQPFVVLNRPGANTNLGTLSVVRSRPDGYTLLIASFGLVANPSLYRKLAFDPQTDLEPITLIANTPNRAGRAAIAAGQFAPRIHCLRESAAGRDQLCLLRGR